MASYIVLYVKQYLQARTLIRSNWSIPRSLKKLGYLFSGLLLILVGLFHIFSWFGLLFLATGFGTVIYWLLQSSQRSSIDNKLIDFITVNQFYLTNKDGQIISKVNVVYKYDEAVLKVAFSGQGRWGNDVQKLAIKLQDLTNLPVVNEYVIFGGWYCYELSLSAPKRYLINNLNQIKTLLVNSQTSIPIDDQTSWDYRKTPHMLVAGITGSGKTYFLNWVIICLAYRKIETYIIDPKKSDLSQLAPFLGQDRVVTSVGQSAGLLRVLSGRMDERYQKINQFGRYGADWFDAGMKPIFLVFDEVAALMAVADKKTASEVMSALKNLILKGRQAGIFIIISTQRPDADALDTAIRDQLGIKIALGSMSAIGYSMVFGKNYDNLTSNVGVGIGYCLVDGDSQMLPKLIKTPNYRLSVPDILKRYLNNQ